MTNNEDKSSNGKSVLDVSWQRIYTERCENEKRIRMRWFTQNKQRLLDNLEKDEASDAMRKKFREFKEYHEQWKIEEPSIKPSIEEKEPSLSKEEISIDYMRPIDPSVLQILYESGLGSHEARKKYLQKRHELKREDRFYCTECTNWEYGWHLNDFTKEPSTKFGRRLIIKDSFYSKNLASVNRHSDLSRKAQSEHLVNDEC